MNEFGINGPNNINVTAITVLNVTNSCIKGAKQKVEKKGADEDIEERKCSTLVVVPIQFISVVLSQATPTQIKVFARLLRLVRKHQ